MSSHGLPDRFASKVDFDAPGGCWTWTAGCRSDGYGLYRDGLAWGAHRYAFDLLRGPIPEGMLLDHTCFNRKCVNPDHLRIVTNKQNLEHRQGVQSNSSSGVRNVYWHKRDQRWAVKVGHNGRRIHGGQFVHRAEAEAAAVRLRAELFTHDDAPQPST